MSPTITPMMRLRGGHEGPGERAGRVAELTPRLRHARPRGLRTGCADPFKTRDAVAIETPARLG